MKHNHKHSYNHNQSRTHHKKMTRKQNHALSKLIELILVIAVTGAIVVISTKYYEITNFSKQVDASIEMVQSVITAAEDWNISNDSYSGITGTAFLVEQGLLKSELQNPNANPWGGSIDVHTNRDGQSITIQLKNIPITPCKELDKALRREENIGIATCDAKGYCAAYPDTATAECR
jgi:hypothetical protein